MEHNRSHHSDNNILQAVLYLDGLFFLKKNIIKQNTEFVQQTFQDLYKHISYN